MGNQENKALVWQFWEALNHAAPESVPDIVRHYVAKDVDWHGPAPIDDLRGVEALIEKFWCPLVESFGGLTRDSYIFMGGRYNDKDWVSAMGYFSGTFAKDWLNIPATNEHTRIRFGEFCAVQDGRIVECYLSLDVLDVMRQAGHLILEGFGGKMGFIPRPDGGVLLSPQNDAESAKSLKLLEDVIGGLNSYDGQDVSSTSSGDFKPTNYAWYGPCGIGTAKGLDEFAKYHQQPMLNAVPDRVSGDHKARFGEGNFVCCTGWPSIRATHLGEYFGVPATGKRVTMRVMDWFLRDGNYLTENRVWIDLVDFLRQLDVDVFAELERRVNRA